MVTITHAFMMMTDDDDDDYDDDDVLYNVIYHDISNLMYKCIIICNIKYYTTYIYNKIHKYMYIYI